MLAGTLTEKDFDKLQFPMVASPKIDGIRCIIHPELGAVTRTLKPIPNDFIREALNRPELHGFDGELVFADDHTDFQKTVSSVMTKAGQPKVKYIAFDYVPTEVLDGDHDFRQTVVGHVIREIENLGFKEGDIQIEKIESYVVRNIEGVLELEEIFLAKGYEGLMLRNPDRPYKYGRSSVNPNQQHLLKLKRFVDAEAVVIGFEEWMHNDNEATINELGHTQRSSHKENKRGGEKLGKFLVRGINGRFKDVEFPIGGGNITHAERKEIWENQDQYLGKILTYKFFDVATKDKPRHGNFKSFREGF
jgi:DNA ligase-1